MTQQQYIDYFEAKAAAMGDDPAAKVRRFCTYLPDAMFLPDVSRFAVDLSEMCMLLGLYEFSIGGNSGRGNDPLMYQAGILLVKSVKQNDFEAELATMSEAEELAKSLYVAARQDVCSNDYGYWFGGTKMADRPWSIQKIKLSHDNTVGVEIRFQFKVNANFTALKSNNPFIV